MFNELLEDLMERRIKSLDKPEITGDIRIAVSVNAWELDRLHASRTTTASDRWCGKIVVTIFSFVASTFRVD